MASVEEAISRLDGVVHVSAGWWTNSATIGVAEGRELALEEVDGVLSERGFRARSLVRRP